MKIDECEYCDDSTDHSMYHEIKRDLNEFVDSLVFPLFCLMIGYFIYSIMK